LDIFVEVEVRKFQPFLVFFNRFWCFSTVFWCFFQPNISFFPEVLPGILLSEFASLCMFFACFMRFYMFSAVSIFQYFSPTPLLPQQL